MLNRDELPESLAALPWDERRGLPVPFMNMTYPQGPDGPGVPDFTGIWGPAVIRCARERLCGICGRELGYWMAFIGGPRSAAARTYTDPPFHPEPCLETALRLCPHIALQRHKRVPEHRVGEDKAVPKNFYDDKPSEWVVGVTRDYQLLSSQGVLVFKAAPFKRTRRFSYEDGKLVELAAAGR